MGSSEKCPKCKSALRYESTGYATSRAREGHAVPVAGHYSCWCCGYYKEAEEPAVQEITVEMKNVTNYPKAIRAIGEFGWLRQIVEEEMPKITRLKAHNWSWARIYKDLATKYPEIAHCGKGSIGNILLLV